MLGLVGGCGPESTIEYYSKIIYGWRERTKSDSYPKLVINSIDMTEMLSMADVHDWDSMTNLLANGVKVLQSAGAKYAAIACNTGHIVFNKVQDAVDIPIISIVETSCQYASRQKYKKALFLGTKMAMQSTFFKDVYSANNIEIIVPDSTQQLMIHDIIFPELEEGIVIPEKKQQLLSILSTYSVGYEIDAIILGCTELPIMLKECDTSLPLINTTKLHIEAILNKMCAQ